MISTSQYISSLGKLYNRSSSRGPPPSSTRTIHTYAWLEKPTFFTLRMFIRISQMQSLYIYAPMRVTRFCIEQIHYHVKCSTILSIIICMKYLRMITHFRSFAVEEIKPIVTLSILASQRYDFLTELYVRIEILPIMVKNMWVALSKSPNLDMMTEDPKEVEIFSDASENQLCLDIEVNINL